MASLSTAPSPAVASLEPCASAKEIVVPDFASIYEEHARAIYYLALRFLGNPAQAEDATQDVFVKAFRALDGFRHGSSLRTWLYRIAINHCQNLQHSWHQRHIETGDDGLLENSADAHQDSPFRVAELKELGERIQKCLDALPAEYRLLILLVADENLTYDQIGELTHQSGDSVRGKLYRARRTLKTAFDKTA